MIFAKIIGIVLYLFCWILLSLSIKDVLAVQSWLAILVGFAVGFVVMTSLYWFGYKLIDEQPEITKLLARKKEEKRSRAKPTTKPSVSDKLTAKLHLLTIRKKWQKSSHSRHIPAMARKLKKWAKTNPDIKSIISVVLSQMQDLATATCIFEDILKDSEFGYRGQESRQAFEFTVSQIRRNFIDIYNLLILAGANQGKATTKTLDQIALARELNSNRIKLELLNNLNAEVVQFVNQVDSAYDNAMMEAEIEFIARKNAARLGTQPSPISHLNAGAESDTAVPSAGAATSQPSATASSASTSQTS